MGMWMVLFFWFLNVRANGRRNERKDERKDERTDERATHARAHLDLGGHRPGGPFHRTVARV